MEPQTDSIGQSSPAQELNQERLQAAMDQAVYEMLRPSSFLLALALAAWTLSYWLEGEGLIVISAPATLFFLLLGVFFERLNLDPRHANQTGVVMTAILISHRLIGIALANEVQQTTSLILILIGAGFILLSTPSLVGITAATLLAWAILAWRAHFSGLWTLFALELVSAAVLAFIIHSSRRHSFRRQEQLRHQNDLRNAELEHRALQLETLIAAGQNITAILDLNVLLTHVVDLVQERFGYYYVGIFCPDASEQYMVSQAGTGESGRQLTRDGFRLKIGAEGLIGWVAQHREAVCVNDVSQDSRYVSSDVVPQTASELVLPLEFAGQFLGVLDIQSNRRNAFTPGDVRVFQSLADQIAVAIQNAASYQEERSRRLLTETLNRVGRLISRSLNQREVLDLLLENLERLVHFDRGSVMLQHDSELEIAAAYGFPDTSNPLQIRVPIRPDDVFGQIHLSRQPLSVPEVLERRDWQQVEDLPQARSWAGVPLISSEDKVIGMFSLTRETPTPFSSDEIEWVTAFAAQAVVALQNAHLYSRLNQAYEQLERLDRTKSDFITVASHELRTPLTTLRGFSQILLKDQVIHTDPMRQEMVEGIYTGAIRLYEIVNSMVDMARIDSRTLQLYIEPVELPRVIRKVVKQFQEAIEERRLNVTIAEMDAIPELRADGEALEKVFYHLLMNAIKYTPDGGKIMVAARLLPAGADGTASDSFELTVADTGIGIDPRYHDLIFAKFYQTGEVALHSSGRTKFKGGGPGLGLAIVKGIVEAHNGQIWVESAGYNEQTCPGATFHVVMPLYQSEENQ